MYRLQLTDASSGHSVTFQLSAQHVEQNALDVVFDIIGADSSHLAGSNIIAPQDAEPVKSLQSTLFDQDSQGKFIRENVRITCNGNIIDPDRPLKEAFAAGANPAVLHATIESLDAPESANVDEKVWQFARMLFIHQIAEAKSPDVTVEQPQLQPLLDWAEKEQLLEIDVKNHAYKLSEKGKQIHNEQLAEAQELIRRYDIYGDVDIDASGAIHMDTGLGKDFRVPIFELEGVDPFRARFLIGLNDGEWKTLNWIPLALDKGWYEEIFAPVESAPSISELGETNLQRIVEEGKKIMRRQTVAGDSNGNMAH